MERKRSPRYAEVDSKVCVSCGTCIHVCPKEAISVFRGCFARVDEELCIGCRKCAKVCPTACIAILERRAVG